jgi:hypothetical protein
LEFGIWNLGFGIWDCGLRIEKRYTPFFCGLTALSSFSVSDVPFSEQANGTSGTTEQVEQRNKWNNGTSGTTEQVEQVEQRNKWNIGNARNLSNLGFGMADFGFV